MTMTQPAAPAPVAAPTAPSPAPAATPAPRTSNEDRAQSLIEKYRAEETSPSEAGADGAAEQPSTPQDGPAVSAPASGDEAKGANTSDRQERLARIAKVREREQADRLKRQREEQRRAQERGHSDEIEKLRKRNAELEPLSKVFESEESLLAEAERRDMTPDKLISWMRQRISDPQAIAQRQVKTEADALRAEMQRQREEFEEYKRSVEQQQTEAQAQYQAQQRAHSFLNDAQAKVQTHPLTAQMLKRYGPQGLIAYANTFVAPLLPQSYDVAELHDHVEQLLAETQFQSASPGPATSTKPGAGQPITTLSNSIAGERSTVAVETPLHKMPLDDRAEFLKDKYRREQ